MKKLLKAIWRSIPAGGIKNKIHCLYYYRDGFSFSYRNGLFFTRGPHGIRMATYEAPFSIVRYYNLFLKYFVPKQGEVVVDAGAYNGHVSVLLSRLVGPSGTVVAFEPDPGNLSICTKNIELNECGNIILVEKGLWNEETVLEFNSNSSKASSVYYQADDASKIRISVTSLDSFFQKRNLMSCHFIKMNIEGSEIKALEGAAGIIRKYKPAIAVTTDHWIEGKQTTERVEAVLKSYQYSAWTEAVKTARLTYAR